MSKLRQWRLDHEWTLNEVSALSGYSIGTISRVERGERELSAQAKVTLARRLGADIRDLFEVPDAEKVTAA